MTTNEPITIVRTPHVSKRNHPPGPRGGLILCTSRSWRPNPVRYMQQLVRTYGPAVRYRYALGYHGYLFVHPEHYRQILEHNPRNYTKKHPLYEVLGFALGDGLVTLDGDSWQRHRKLVHPAFRKSGLSVVSDLVVRNTNRMVDGWVERCRDDRTSAPFRVDQDLMTLTLTVVAEALFGAVLTTEIPRIAQAFTLFGHSLIQVVTSPFAWLTVRTPLFPAARRLHASANALKSIVAGIIADHSMSQERGASSDLLSILQETRDSDTKTKLTAAEVRDEVLTVLMAGHETSATALSWTLCLLSQHAEVERTLVEEVDRVLGGRSATIESFEQLPYARAVVQESLRLYPPVYSFTRRCEAGDVVGGYDVPAGAFVSLCPFITHRMPELWEAPDRFMPERFLPGAPQPELAFIPFSAGPRQCVGHRFAMVEMVLGLATILQRCALRLPPGHIVDIEPSITLRPRNGMRMQIHLRT